MKLSYQGETLEHNENGCISKEVYSGTREELEEYLASLEVGTGETEGKYISSAILSQKDGPIWNLEILHKDPRPEGSFFSRKPNTAYGQKSARLECGCITVPVETLPTYRKHWDHYLIAGVHADQDGTMYFEHSMENVPEFWETADAFFVMPKEYLNTYRWIRDPAECPVYVGNDRKKWWILRTPTKPGVSYVDKATYRITESIRCRTADSAGEFAANVINRIAVPFERFGIKHGQDCWKCDSASIHWDGRDWIATIVYTMSPDLRPWDKDLYSEASGNRKNNAQ
jgi:hypothetical protein